MTTTAEHEYEEALAAVKKWVDDNPEYKFTGDFLCSSICRVDDPEAMPLGTHFHSEHLAPEELIPILNRLFEAELKKVLGF